MPDPLLEHGAARPDLSLQPEGTEPYHSIQHKAAEPDFEIQYEEIEPGHSIQHKTTEHNYNVSNISVKSPGVPPKKRPTKPGMCTLCLGLAISGILMNLFSLFTRF